MKITREGNRHNNAGPIIKKFRLAAKPSVTQDDLSGRLASQGITLDRSAISRIESQTRVIFDYELVAIAKALRVQSEVLLNGEPMDVNQKVGAVEAL